MKFAGFYNFGGGGTEEITGGSNENIPSFIENVCQNDKMFFSGNFANLSRELVHVTLGGFGSSEVMHKHDLRPYEALKVINIPLKSIAVHVPSGIKVGFHGMGALWQTEDEDEYAVIASKSELSETLFESPQFNTDYYARTDISSATTTDLVVSDSDDDFAVYKVTVSCQGAQDVDLLWTDSSNSNVKYIGHLHFTGKGSFVYDFDPSLLRNPNRQGGKLRATTATANSTRIDVIGHMVHASQ